MVITIAIACVTTSAAVSIATTKNISCLLFQKFVDSYVDETCKETRKFVNEACERINRR